MKNKNHQFPKIKKNLKTFLTEEEGKITQKSIKKIALGLIMTSFVVGGLMQADKTLAQTCSHTSHASHTSHGSHGSHGSHSSW